MLVDDAQVEGGIGIALSRQRRLLTGRDANPPLALFFQQPRDRGLKRRQIAFDDIADQGKIDAEILMREDVAGAGDSDPGNLWTLGCKGFRTEVADDLTDDSRLRITASWVLWSDKKTSPPSAVYSRIVARHSARCCRNTRRSFTADSLPRGCVRARGCSATPR